MTLRWLAALALGATLLTCGCGADNSATEAAPRDTNSGPVAFTFPDLDSRQRQFAEWQGQVVVVNFWAPWCPPCRKEMPDLMALQEKYAARGVTVVGITVDTHDNAKAFADKLKVNFPILLGEDGGLELAQSLGNTIGALPYTVIVDRQGRVAHTHRSMITLQQAENLIAPLL